MILDYATVTPRQEPGNVVIEEQLNLEYGMR